MASEAPSLLQPLEPYDAPFTKDEIDHLHGKAIRLIAHAGVETGPFAEGECDALLLRGRRLVPELELTLKSEQPTGNPDALLRFLPVRDYHEHVGEYSINTPFKKIQFGLRNTGDRALEILVFAGIRRRIDNGLSLHLLTDYDARKEQSSILRDRRINLFSTESLILPPQSCLDELGPLDHPSEHPRAFKIGSDKCFVLCYVREYCDAEDKETPLNMFLF